MASGDYTVTLTLSGTKTSGDTIEAFSESFTKAGVIEDYNREFTVPTTLTTLFTPGTLGASGLATLNGFIVWNDDATNFVTIGVLLAATDAYYVKIPAKRFHVIWSRDFDVTTGGAFGAFVAATSIDAKADTAAVVLKIRAF
jgi:hypothetical protein